MTEEYNIGAIRRMLLAAFSGEELRRLCLDDPALRPVVASFGPGMGLDDMVDHVVDFCRTRLAWDDLLAAVRQHRAPVYARFAPELGGSPPPAHPAARPAAPSAIKILFLAANPRGTSQLRLDEEVRAIDQALRMAEFRDRFDLIQHWAVRVSDLQALLLRCQPHIVHFSGHGSERSEIVLEDAQGGPKPVPSRALAGLFAALKDNIRCVVLNACYSKAQAQAIAQEIECVVGMSKAIGDEAAISFAFSFYQALGYGRSVQTAFDLGCSQIGLEDLREENTPKLIARLGDPREIFMIQVRTRKL